MFFGSFNALDGLCCVDCNSCVYGPLAWDVIGLDFLGIKYHLRRICPVTLPLAGPIEGYTVGQTPPFFQPEDVAQPLTVAGDYFVEIERRQSIALGANYQNFADGLNDPDNPPPVGGQMYFDDILGDYVHRPSFWQLGLEGPHTTRLTQPDENGDRWAVVMINRKSLDDANYPWKFLTVNLTTGVPKQSVGTDEWFGWLLSDPKGTYEYNTTDFYAAQAGVNAAFAKDKLRYIVNRDWVEGTIRYLPVGWDETIDQWDEVADPLPPDPPYLFDTNTYTSGDWETVAWCWDDATYWLEIRVSLVDTPDPIVEDEGTVAAKVEYRANGPGGASGVLYSYTMTDRPYTGAAPTTLTSGEVYGVRLPGMYHRRPLDGRIRYVWSLLRPDDTEACLWAADGVFDSERARYDLDEVWPAADSRAYFCNVGPEGEIIQASMGRVKVESLEDTGPEWEMGPDEGVNEDGAAVMEETPETHERAMYYLSPHVTREGKDGWYIVRGPAIASTSYQKPREFLRIDDTSADAWSRTYSIHRDGPLAGVAIHRQEQVPGATDDPDTEIAGLPGRSGHFAGHQLDRPATLAADDERPSEAWVPLVDILPVIDVLQQVGTRAWGTVAAPVSTCGGPGAAGDY